MSKSDKNSVKIVFSALSILGISLLSACGIGESPAKKSIKIDTRRIRADKSEVIKLKSDSNLAKKYLGWKAECNNYQRFSQALKETFAWYKENNFNKKLSTSKDYVI